MWGLSTYRLTLRCVVRLSRTTCLGVIGLIVIAGAVYCAPRWVRSVPAVRPHVMTIAAPSLAAPATRIETLMAHDDNPSATTVSDVAANVPSLPEQRDDVHRVYALYEEGKRLVAEDDAAAALNVLRAVRGEITKMPVRPPFAATLDEEIRAAESRMTSGYDAALATIREKMTKNRSDDPWEAMAVLKELNGEAAAIIANVPDHPPAQRLGDELARGMRSVAARMLAAAVSIEDYQGCAAARAAYARVIEAAGEDTSGRRAEEAIKRCDKS